MSTAPIVAQPDLHTLAGAWIYFQPYRKRIMYGALVGMVLGVLITLLIPHKYTTNATLLFPSSTSTLANLTGAGNGDQMSTLPLLGGLMQVPKPGTSAKTAIIILQSRPVQDVVLKKYHLKEHWKIKKDKDVRKNLNKQFSMKEGDAGDLTITFSDPDREVSYQVTQTFVDELKRKTDELGLNPADDSVKFLSDQVNQAETDVNAAHAAQQVFEKKYGMVSMPDQVAAFAQQYTSLQSDTDRARIESAVATRYATMLSASAKQVIAKSMDPMLNGGPLNALYQRVVDLEAQRELLRDKYTTTSPEYQDLTVQIKVARHELAAEITRQLGLVKSGSAPVVSEAVIEAALKQTRVERMTSLLHDLKLQIASFPGMKNQYARLRLEVDIQEARLTLLKTELEKAKIIDADQAPAFVVADPPARAEAPESRHGIPITLVMLMLGAFCMGLTPYRKWQQTLVARERAKETSPAEVA